MIQFSFISVTQEFDHAQIKGINPIGDNKVRDLQRAITASQRLIVLSK